MRLVAIEDEKSLKKMGLKKPILVVIKGNEFIKVASFNNVEMFHTIFWLYALFPITWVLATICNTIAILITLPKDLRKLDDSIKREPQILQEQ